MTVQGGGCQAASGIDSVEELSWGSREGEELPLLTNVSIRATKTLPASL
ncbi:hypothetical protein MICAB_2850006 [Microcystis aeruginosa PCC 9717]|uniref:Uncharacterized protein n=1 Tax=Microcystis aeruginosa PCC 9717 TaxID=1160286 RepID=I4FMY4_MICAE|nr:hypothetical protein MICAB_2850006 [Microcystis aeruginosa PCC 9717]